MQTLKPISSDVVLRCAGALLPWDIYEPNGTLLAKRGTPMTQCAQFWRENPRPLYVEHGVFDLESVNISTQRKDPEAVPAVLELQAGAIELLDLPAAPADSTVLDQLEFWYLRVRSVLGRYSTSPDWLYEVFSTAGGLRQYFLKHSESAQFVLAVRSPFEETGYAGWHPLFRACLLFRATEGLLSPQEQSSLLAAALTADIGMYKVSELLARQDAPLSAEQRRQVTEHPELSVEMLTKAGLSDAMWLELVRLHHEAPDPQAEPGSWPFLCGLFRACDILTARAAARKDRPALSLTAALADVCMDPQTRMPTKIGQRLASSLGIPPSGSLIQLPEGELGVVEFDNRVVLLTDSKGIARVNWSKRQYQRSVLRTFKAVPPVKAKALRLLLEQVAKQVCETHRTLVH